jgi:hypothetical protein
MREKRNAYRLLVRKPEGKRPLGRPRRGWVDNIRMNLGEVGWVDVDWIGLAQDTDKWRTLVNSVMNLRDLYSSPSIIRIKEDEIGRVCSTIRGEEEHV